MNDRCVRVMVVVSYLAAVAIFGWWLLSNPTPMFSR